MKIKHLFLCLLALALISCQTEPSIPRSAGIRIDPKSIEKVKTKALSGDRDSAFRLSLYYAEWEMKPKEARKWYTIAYNLRNPGNLSFENTPEELYGSGK